MIVETTGLDFDQVETIKKGFDGFDKEGGAWTLHMKIFIRGDPFVNA